MSVKSPSAPTCPGTLDPTSPQSFPMTFTKFSKSPKPPKMSDNTAGHTGSAPNCSLRCFFVVCFWVAHCRCCFLRPKNPVTFFLMFLIHRAADQRQVGRAKPGRHESNPLGGLAVLSICNLVFSSLAVAASSSPDGFRVRKVGSVAAPWRFI